MTAVTKAVIPAAGFGTRLLPATKAVPKELLPVIDKPVLQYVVDEALDSGVDELIIITSRGKESLAAHLLDNPQLEAHLRAGGKQRLLDKVHGLTRAARVRFVEQPEQRGLGDAVLCARDAVGEEPFAVLLGDTIIEPEEDQPPGLAQIMAVHARTGASVVAVRRVPREIVNRYGIVDGDAMPGDERSYRLHRLVEKPEPDAAPSNLAIAGRYILTPEVFEHLASGRVGHGGEVQLTDAMNRLAADGRMVAHLWRATRYDIGNRADYLSCIVALAERDPELAGYVKRS